MSWSKGRITDTYRADAVDAEIAEKDARIAELEAELAERDQLISLFKDMWASVTEDQYSELMDRWAARVEKGSE